MKPAIRGILGLGAFVTCAGSTTLYWRLHPTVKLADVGRIRALLPRELLAPLPKNLAAERRFLKLSEVCGRLVHVNGTILLNGTLEERKKALELDRLVAKTNRSIFGQIDSVLRQGPMESVDSTKTDVQRFERFRRFRTAASDLADAAIACGADGNSKDCLNYLRIGTDLSCALHAASRDMMAFNISVSAWTTTDQAALTCCRSNYLDASCMRKLLECLPPGRDTDPALREALRGEFQNYDEAELIDPGNTTISTALAMGGNYDAAATAALFGRIYTEQLENSSRDWQHQAHSVKDEIDRETSSLPSNGTGDQGSDQDGNGRNGSDLFLADMKDVGYRVQMNSIPNSIGKSLAQGVAMGSFMVEGEIREETRRELTRAIIAIHLYMLDHEQVIPMTLQKLVAGGYLSRLPMDLFASKPLIYVPAKELVYSVGQDGVNDGGDVGESGSGKDLGYCLTEPTPKPASSSTSPFAGRPSGAFGSAAPMPSPMGSSWQSQPLRSTGGQASSDSYGR